LSFILFSSSVAGALLAAKPRVCVGEQEQQQQPGRGRGRGEQGAVGPRVSGEGWGLPWAGWMGVAGWGGGGEIRQEEEGGIRRKTKSADSMNGESGCRAPPGHDWCTWWDP